MAAMAPTHDVVSGQAQQTLPRHVPLPLTSGASVSIMSYNILSHHHVRCEGFPRTMFAHCSDADLLWEHRKDRVVATILASNADVICLQEMGLEAAAPGKAEMPAWTRPLEEAGYICILQDDVKRAATNATLYRKDRFDLVAAEHRSRALLLWLRVRDAHGAGDAGYYVVCNAHLEGHPDKHRERRSQLQSILKQITAQARKSGDAHVVIAGDFNCSLDEHMADLLGAGIPFGLQDAFPVTDGFTLGALTWAEPNRPAAVDHVLVGSSLRVMLRRLVLDEDEVEVVLQSGLPSVEHPSDHLPLALVVDPIGLPVGRAAEPAVASVELSEDLLARWTEILANAPVVGKGKPSPEDLERLKIHASEKKTFLASLQPEVARQLQQTLKPRKA